MEEKKKRKQEEKAGKPRLERVGVLLQCVYRT